MSNPNRDNLYAQQLTQDAVSATATLLGAAAGVAGALATVNQDATALELDTPTGAPFRVLSVSGTAQPNPKIISGAAMLDAGSATVDLTGDAIFGTTYEVLATHVGDALVNAGTLSIEIVSVSQFKIHSTDASDVNQVYFAAIGF